MNKIVKKRGANFLFVVNLICILFLLAGISAPYVNPVKYWPVALSGLLFPGFFIPVLLFAIGWGVVKSKRIFYSVGPLLLAVPALYTTFGMHFFSGFKEAKETKALRVLSWNVGLMNYTQTDTVNAIRNNAIIFEKIKTADADVICLQEFFSEIVPGHHYNIMDSLARNLGYPYYYFSRDVAKVDGNFFSGSIIFSRYKMIDSSKTIFPLTGLYGGSIIRAGILFNNDSIDVYTSRLQLMKFQGDEYKEVHNIKTGSGNTIADTKSLIGKLRNGYSYLSQQADFIRKVLDSCKRPVIFAGDLNNIPLSYTYGKVKGDLNDAWAAKGRGFGRTFQYISPTLRLDHLFYDDHFKILQVRRMMEEGETDHHGLLADFLINTK